MFNEVVEYFNEDNILSTCALRFDPYEYTHSTPDQIMSYLDNWLQGKRESFTQTDQLIAFFLLQRWLYKWGGEYTPHTHPDWGAFRELFLNVYQLDVPAGAIIASQYQKWETTYKPRLDEVAAFIRRIHENTKYEDTGEIFKMEEGSLRAQGCLLGQLSGDSLGSLVEFQTPEQIRRNYPEGVRDLIDGGTWGTIAGQPTDDSEMALMLAQTLVGQATYQAELALMPYQIWLKSEPFDCGTTIASALSGRPNPHSQANGALMRVSPLGIFGAWRSLDSVAEWAMQDAALTHPHPICQQANALFAMAIAKAISNNPTPHELYFWIVEWAKVMEVDSSLMEAVTAADHEPPSDYTRQQGWVLIAFQNALWQLLHAPNTEEAIVDTVMRGGDTDTNAAICGALLGAVYGRDSIPSRWTEKLLNCRPQKGNPQVRRPRPEYLWPIDALTLAEKLYQR